MYFDSLKMLGVSGVGVILISPKGDKLNYVLQIHFKASSNIAEYEARLHDLRIAISVSIHRLLCHRDLDLAV